MSKLSIGGSSHYKVKPVNKKLHKKHNPEYRDEALKLAERIAARELSLYDSQPSSGRLRKEF